MKTSLFFLAILTAAVFQVKAQSLEEIGEICELNQNDVIKAAGRFSKLKKASDMDKKNMMTSMSYFYLKYLFAQNQFKADVEVQNRERGIIEQRIRRLENALDTIAMITMAFETMPEGGLLTDLFIKNTQNKLLKRCPCIDQKSFSNLSKRYEDALQALKAEQSLYLEDLMKDFELKKTSLKRELGETETELDKARGDLNKVKSDLGKAEKEVKAYRVMFADSIKMSARKRTDKEALPKAVAKDSISLEVISYRPDSVEVQVYLASKFFRDSISKEHGVAEYCNEKVNAMVRNAVYETMNKWFNLSGTDMLSVSATIVGEADDVWLKEGERHTFHEANTCQGIGKALGLKDGDGISNDTIALLRALSAERCLNDGIKKILSSKKKAGKKNAHIEIKTVIKPPKNWMKDPAKQKAPQFRKEVIVLKCNNCMAKKP